MLYMKGIYENGEFISAIVSTSEDVELDNPNEKIVSKYTLEDRNFTRYDPDITKLSQEEIESIAERTKHDWPLLMVDLDHNLLWAVNKALSNTEEHTISHSTVKLDPNAFPNGVKDILTYVNV